MFEMNDFNADGHIKLRSSQALFCNIAFYPSKFRYIVQHMQNRNNIAKLQANNENFYIPVMLAATPGEHKSTFVIFLQLVAGQLPPWLAGQDVLR